MEEVGGDDDAGGGRSGFDGGVEVDGESAGKARQGTGRIQLLLRARTVQTESYLTYLSRGQDLSRKVVNCLLAGLACRAVSFGLRFPIVQQNPSQGLPGCSVGRLRDDAQGLVPCFVPVSIAAKVRMPWPSQGHCRTL
jgi:hypothetical protein